MGWYGRSRLILNAFLHFSSKIVPKTPIQQPVSRIARFNPFPPTFLNNPWPTGFSQSSRTRNLLGFRTGQYPCRSPFTGTIARRHYYVDNRQIWQYFRWIKSPRVVLIVVVLGSAIVVSVYFGSYETIPYSKRNHFVMLPKSFERWIGEMDPEEMKVGEMLPANHPESVRVGLIAKNIIEALERGLKKEQVWTDSATGHLEGVKWEIFIVKEAAVQAGSSPGGKIFLSTGWFELFPTDAEIATVIAHEVGHIVARHSAEFITKVLWFTILQLIILVTKLSNSPPFLVSNYLLHFHFSQKREFEADYIGLLLMASAGYDPRAAPYVYQKLEDLDDGWSLKREYLSTHPSFKRRAKKLAKANVMEQAFAIYRQSIV